MTLILHPFGRTGMRVSRLALGAMRFGAPQGRGIDAAASRKVFDAYLSGGGNFIDTANVYNDGSSERTLADLITGERDRLVIATKYGMAGQGGEIVLAGGSRKAMATCVEQSLRRLKTDRIDILYLHRWDFQTAIDEVMRAADDLVAAGKVMAIGLSNTPAWIAARAATMAELRGWTRLAGLQLPYHLLDRSIEREFLPMARDMGLGVAAWAPLARGLLAAPEQGEPHPVKDALRRLASDIGVSPAQIALAWVCRRAFCPIFTIVGAENVTQVEDAVAAMALRLDPDHLAMLDRATPPALGQVYGELADPIYTNLLTAFQPDRLVDAASTRALP